MLLDIYFVPQNVSLASPRRTAQDTVIRQEPKPKARLVAGPIQVAGTA